MTPPAPPGTLPARPAAQVGGGVSSGWPADPTEAAQLEETLSLLSLKRRKVVYRYLETGNARQSVLDAGYRCKDVRSADDVAREILADPKVQYVLQALLEARGLGPARLDQLLAVHVARFDSPDGGDRDRSLRGIGMFYKYGVPRPPASAATGPDDILSEMTPDELERFATHRIWPERFRNRLRASGASIHDAAPPTTEAQGPLAEREDDAGTAAADPPPAEASSPARPAAPPEPDTPARGACGDDDSGDDDAEAPSPRTTWAPASHQPTSGSREAERESAHSSGSFAAAAARPEDRVWAPPAPPDAPHALACAAAVA